MVSALAASRTGLAYRAQADEPSRDGNLQRLINEKKEKLQREVTIQEQTTGPQDDKRQRLIDEKKEEIQGLIGIQWLIGKRKKEIQNLVTIQEKTTELQDQKIERQRLIDKKREELRILLDIMEQEVGPTKQDVGPVPN